MKIIVVDDNPKGRQMVSYFVQKLGHEVVQADNGQDVLNLLEDKVYDLALVDIKMPQMSGVELLRIIKELHRPLDVVLFTGHGELETAMAAIRYGAIDYLLKPINVNELANVLSKAAHLRSERGKTQKNISIFLYSQQSVITEGIRSILQGEKDFNYIGYAKYPEGISIFRDGPIDIILVDIDSIGRDYATQIKLLSQKFPKSVILALSTSDDKVPGVPVIDLRQTDNHVISKIRTAYRNRGNFATLTSPEPQFQAANLSIKETKILSLVAKGKTNKEIAELLNLSPITIKNYVSIILQKMGIPNRTTAAALILENPNLFKKI